MSMYIKLEFPDFYKETPLFLSESSGEVGYPSRVSRACPERSRRKGESRPFRGRKGQVSPACKPQKGHFGAIEAKKQWSHLLKIFYPIKSNNYKEIPLKIQETPDIKRYESRYHLSSIPIHPFCNKSSMGNYLSISFARP